MPYRGRPVASFYQRAVYKTEFDIFKQNTDIDLISLASLEDDSKETDFLNRRCSSSRPAEEKTVGQDYSGNKAFSRCISARYPAKSGSNYSPKRKTYGRTCRSALDVHRRVNYDNHNLIPSQTTQGVKKNETSDLSSLNKRARINVDFKYEKYTRSVNIIRPNSAARRQLKSANTGRSRSGPGSDKHIESKPQRNKPSARKRLKSAGSSVRARSATSKKNTGIELDNRKTHNDLSKSDAVFEEDCVDIVPVEEVFVSEQISGEHDGKDNDNSNINDVRKVNVFESPDSGVVNDFYEHSSPINTFTGDTKEAERHEDDIIESISVCSAEVSACENGDSPTNTAYETPTQYNLYDVNDLIRNLTDQEVDEKHDTVTFTGANSEVDSIFSVSEISEEEIRVEEVVKPTVEDSETKLVQDLKDITMSKEAKSVILETLYDLKGNRSILKDNKENIESNMRFKSVGKQKRMKENRNRYDQLMRERTETMLQLNIRTKENTDTDDDIDNEYESDFEESINEEINKNKQMFPSIKESAKHRSNSHASSSVVSKQIYSLDQVKKRKYKIPGIGNYDLVTSPDNDFEITPPGFDCRYDKRPLMTKEELDPPPKFIQERSIQKCKKWLKNVNLSPLSLNPVINKR